MQGTTTPAIKKAKNPRQSVGLNAKNRNRRDIAPGYKKTSYLREPRGEKAQYAFVTGGGKGVTYLIWVPSVEKTGLKGDVSNSRNHFRRTDKIKKSTTISQKGANKL